MNGKNRIASLLDFKKKQEEGKRKDELENLVADNVSAIAIILYQNEANSFWGNYETVCIDLGMAIFKEVSADNLELKYPDSKIFDEDSNKDIEVIFEFSIEKKIWARIAVKFEYNIDTSSLTKNELDIADKFSFAQQLLGLGEIKSVESTVTKPTGTIIW